MSYFAWMGAIEAGLIFGLVAIAVYISFRVLDFPDLTVEGSFPLGAATTAVSLVNGIDPLVATALGALVGAAAGCITALLTVSLGFLHLLSGILVSIALYSINLRIMGQPNIALLQERTIFSYLQDFGLPDSQAVVATLLIFAFASIAIVSRFLSSQIGLAIRATGINSRMAAANGVDTKLAVFVGLAISNGLVGLAGSLFAQSQGSADVAMGIGTIVVGLAAVILGESFISSSKVLPSVLGAILGALVFRVVVALALNLNTIGLQSQDLNLITALLVIFALLMPRVRKRIARKSQTTRDARAVRGEL